MLEPDSEPIPEDFYYFSDHTISVFQNQTGLTFVFDGKTVVRAESAVEYVSEDLYRTCAIYYDENKTLYFVNKNGYTKVRENVRDAVLSSNGNYIAFICSDADSSELIVKYDTDKNTSVIIEKSSYFSKESGLILSHNGNSLIYSKDFADIGISETYLSIAESQGEHLDLAYNVLTVSNDGQYILQYDKNGEYYLIQKDKTINLGKVSPQTIKSNVNCTEFLYSVPGNGSYLIQENDEPIKISDLIFGHMYIPTHALKGNGVIFAVNKFTDKLFEASQSYSSQHSIVYLDKDFSNTILENVSFFDDKYVSYNISTIYFVENNTVFKVSTKLPGEKTIIAQNVISDSLTLTRDGKYLYYIDQRGTLYRMSNGIIKSIAENVTSVSLGNDNYLYFIDENDEIYFIKGASLPKKAATSDIDGNVSILESNGVLFIVSNGSLYSFRGEDMKLLSDDVIALYEPHHSADETSASLFTYKE